MMKLVQAVGDVVEEGVGRSLNEGVRNRLVERLADDVAIGRLVFAVEFEAGTFIVGSRASDDPAAKLGEETGMLGGPVDRVDLVEVRVIEAPVDSDDQRHIMERNVEVDHHASLTVPVAVKKMGQQALRALARDFQRSY